MAEPLPVHKTVYHKDTGAVTMYAIDAHQAVANHPDDWSFTPWDNSRGANQPNGEPLIAVPNAWAELSTKERIKLARDLGMQGNISGAAADEFIQKYIDENAPAEEEVRAAAVKTPANAEVERAAEIDRQRVAKGELSQDKVDKADPIPPSPLGPAENNPKL